MVIFLHGGIPGVTPYRSGSHVWGRCLELFPQARALDLRGADVNEMAKEVQSALSDIGPCHLVGHDLGGLVALMVATEAPQRVRAVTAVSSVAAAPTGDSVENLTLAYPPQPLWSRASQRWALERVSYSHLHIDDVLLDACVRASPQEASESFAPSLMQAKSHFYETCRGEGIQVPVQVVWGSHDPLGTLDQGLWLFRLVAQHQRAVQFHVINRTGALPFREEPGAFHQIVASFSEAVR
jgi:pimeloyl-ACP methyl ester carboxylesterase